MTKALQPGDLIAHSRVIRALGAGGMGEVYLARDSTLDRDVALEVLPQLAQGDDRVRRCVLEAKSASSLSHPHIITVYEIGCEPVVSASSPRAEKVHYIAMELVDGAALADIIHDDTHRTDLKTLLGYLAQAADGLAKAHASGIVHRDLKPGNIMVSKDGYAKVLDFGLAKLVEKEAAPDATINVATKQALTIEGMIVGTIGYMAPEQILGRLVDHRSDIFSFGCILYECITRQRPFTANSQFEALQKIIHEHPAAIESFVPDSPVELRYLVARCLAKGPDDRIPSMKDVASELRRISNTYEVLARSAGQAGDQTMFFPTPSGAIPPQSDAAAPAKKKPIALMVGVAVVIVGLGGFAVSKFALGGASSGLSEEALSQMKISAVLSNEVLQSIAVSPDGRLAAAVSLAGARYQLQVRQINTGQDVPIIPAQEARIAGLTFSPEGDHLWYVSRDADNELYSSLFQVPSLGVSSSPRRVVLDADTEPTLSPDGKSIAFIRGAPADRKTMLVVHPLEGGGADRNVATVTSEHDAVIDKPRWSPDGKKIAVISNEEPGRPQLVVFDVQSGNKEPVGSWEGPVIDSMAWMGPEGLVVAGALTPGPIQGAPPGIPSVMRIPLAGGAPQKLLEMPESRIDVARWVDDKTLILAARSTTRPVNNLWRWTVGSPKPVAITNFPTGVIFEVSPSQDGKVMYFTQGSLNRDIIKITGLK